MSKIAVITDSNAHITPIEAKELGIEVVPMPFMIDEETYYEGVTLSREEFYSKMEKGANIVTSQPAPSDVMSIWDKALETHDEIVHIPMILYYWRSHAESRVPGCLRRIMTARCR